MTLVPDFARDDRRHDPVARLLGAGALLVSLCALVFAMAGSSPAAPEDRRAANPAQAESIGGGDDGAARGRRRQSTAGRRPGARRRAPKRTSRGTRGPARWRPEPFGSVRLDSRGRLPASVIPRVAAAATAERLGNSRESDLQLNCAPEAVDLGTWCLDSAPYAVPPEQQGKNDFFFAVKTCVERGGYLPTAAQLLGAAERAKLSSTVSDSDLTASIDETPDDGRKDLREMSATLFTTTAGASAAGSQGVSIGSKGNPLEGEPDPIPEPADPEPSTLQYVTVYDRGNSGGFAGGKPVGSAERFRCAFVKGQGQALEER